MTATAETDPVPNDGDAADDPAIWVNPADPARSTIIGTDKAGGLAVYNLGGQQLQYLADGRLNNVDLRGGFVLDGQPTTIVTAGNRSDDTLAIYRVDPATGELANVAARPIATLPVYGSCMYHSASTGKLYYIVNSETGGVEQYELFDAGGGRVDARQVRAFEVGSQTEGCVADDALGLLYIGEEDVGIWRYGAEPDAGTDRTAVDATGRDGHLTADVEGLTIFDAGAGQGYLLASSQGSDDFTVYERAGDNRYLGRFMIAAGAVDEVTETDGIDVTGANLGPPFSAGLFVAQDVANGRDNQNFKLVAWADIAAQLGLDLSGAPANP